MESVEKSVQKARKVTESLLRRGSDEARHVIQKKILSYLREGEYRKTAARLAGINDRTFRAWCEKDPEL